MQTSSVVLPNSPDTALQTQAPLPQQAQPRRVEGVQTVQHKRLPLCGHKLVLQHEPRHRNCESCWFTFFNVHGDLTKACDEAFQKIGENGLRQIRGPKFAKNFVKFMATLAQWNKQQLQLGKESHEQRISGPDVSDELESEAVTGEDFPDEVFA